MDNFFIFIFYSQGWNQKGRVCRVPSSSLLSLNVFNIWRPQFFIFYIVAPKDISWVHHYLQLTSQHCSHFQGLDHSFGQWSPSFNQSSIKFRQIISLGRPCVCWIPTLCWFRWIWNVGKGGFSFHICVGQSIPCLKSEMIWSLSVCGLRCWGLCGGDLQSSHCWMMQAVGTLIWEASSTFSWTKLPLFATRL